MKKVIIALASTVILSTTLFIACKKESNQKSTNKPVFSKKERISQDRCEPIIRSSPFILNDSNIDKQVDIAAKLHNEYLEYFFQSAVRDKIKYSSPNYDTYFRDVSEKFFENKGIKLQENSYYNCMRTIGPEENIDYLAEKFSDNGKEIFQSVLNEVNQYDQVSEEYFIEKMNNLYTSCNSLDVQESASLKLMIKVGLHSLDYWKHNLDKWQDYFGNDDQVMKTMGSRSNPTNREILIAAGKADLSGAIKGATAGGLGAGPAGAIAGGLVVGGTYSAARIIAGAIFNWW